MKTQIVILIVLFSTINPVKSFCQWNVIQDYGDIYNFQEIFMSSDSIGYITDGSVTNGGNLLKTMDYGNSWNVVYSFTHPESPYTIFFINDTVGFVATCNWSTGEKRIYKTNDGGISFSYSNIYYIPSEFVFPTDSIGYLFCQNSNAYYKTINTGSSWTQNIFPVTINYHPSGFFITNDLGFVVNNDSAMIYKTIDGGNTWNTINISSTEVLYYVHFINDSTGYLNGQSVLWKTIDSGNNWINVNDSSFNGVLNKTQFINDTLGYALGYSYYTVLKTINGGVSWTQQYIDMTYYCGYNDMTFLNDTIGFVIGGNGIDGTVNGIVLKTINGGDNSTIISGKINYDCFTRNYPNPFVNQTTIEYEIKQPSTTNINVAIYDIFGKKIMNYYKKSVYLKDKINVDLTNYPSGIYYYSFIVDGQIIETMKMICVKE